MDEPKFSVNDKLDLFQELVTCGSPVYLWAYAQDGHLAKTNCPELVLNTIFEVTGCKSYIMEYGSKNTLPLIVGAPLGLLWCTAFERRDNEMIRMYVLGPVFNTEISLRQLNEALQNFDIPISFKPHLEKLLQELPVVSTPLFFQYGLMLHYCATGEKLARSDIQYQESTPVSPLTSPHQGDRHQTYAAEQALMWMVREGNLGYQSALGHASEISHGVQITGRPMQQAVISCAVFTSLCVRAAIQGGLSPEAAYTLGDSYIQSMTQCKTVTELTSINHEMYVDFVRRVHTARMNPALSKPVQSCCDYIEAHLEEPITLKQLSDTAGYHDYYFSRKFKKETGVTFNDYIKYARIEKSKLLLSTTNDSIQTIANRLQFCSSSYFSKTFQEITGASPQQWRNSRQIL